MIAEGCLVCSGPLHTTWLGSAVLAAALVYFVALVMASITVLERVTVYGHSCRGAVWTALALPFRWIHRASAAVGAFLAVGLLPPERRPRAPRRELEDRIAELERELEIA